MPASDHAVSKRPCTALTYLAPKISARYAGMVAKPPPYIVRMTQKQETNSTTEPIWPESGTSAYRIGPSTKKQAYVALRPIRSDNEAQMNRPPMLKRLSSPTKPAAAPALIVPLKTSWIIADAWPSTPIPAVTLKHSTTHKSQNCGVLTACSGVTSLLVISAPVRAL